MSGRQTGPVEIAFVIGLVGVALSIAIGGCYVLVKKAFEPPPKPVVITKPPPELQPTRCVFYRCPPKETGDAQ